MLHTLCQQHFRNAIATMHYSYLSPVGAEFPAKMPSAQHSLPAPGDFIDNCSSIRAIANTIPPMTAELSSIGC